MTQNLPDQMVIPSEEEERPVRTFNGHILANDALHCRPRHLWPKGMDELNKHPDWKEAIERYLGAFCDPVINAAKQIHCVACNDQVTGAYTDMDDWRVRGKLEFSMEGTREGKCKNCGYPCRLRHRIMLGTLPLVALDDFPLFYHPSATQRIS